MKITSFLIAFVMLCIGGSAFAQHNLQLDRTGTYSIITGPGAGGPFTYTLPPGGGSFVITSGGTTSSAWLLGGNTGSGASNQIGTLDNTDLNFITGVGPNTRMTIQAGGNIGIGITNPGSLLANATSNILNAGGDGLVGSSINWQMTSGGYIVGLQNNDAATANANGLIVKTRGTAVTNRIFTANSGAGNGTDRFQVFGDGSTAIAAIGTAWAVDASNSNTASTGSSKGLRITTAASNGGTALDITNGNLALPAQLGYTGGQIEKPLLQVTASPVTLGNATTPDQQIIWVLNATGAALTVTNTTVGNFSISAGHGVQFIWNGGGTWIPVTP